MKVETTARWSRAAANPMDPAVHGRRDGRWAETGILGGHSGSCAICADVSCNARIRAGIRLDGSVR